MKKKSLIILLVCISYNLFSQESYMKGYFISNNNERVECMIKREFLLYTPNRFYYKNTSESQEKKLNITTVKEFGIYDISKHIRFSGKVDKSSLELDQLPNKRSPNFKEETLFLNVLVEGKASLYEFRENGMIKFFLKLDNKPIEQLIKIDYLFKNTVQIAENNYYKQQLINELKSPLATPETVKRLTYDKKKLTQLIVNFNEKFNSTQISKNTLLIENKIFNKNNIKHYLNITPRIAYNYSSLHIEYSHDNSIIDFGNKASFAYGLEAEGVLPYFKEQFSILFDLHFQSRKVSGTYKPLNSPLVREISGTYKATDLGVGLRYRHKLKNKSILYVNGILHRTFRKDGEVIEFTRTGNISLHRNAIYYFSFSVGYKFNKKYSFEIKTSLERTVSDDSSASVINYNNHAIVFGYTIF